MAAKRGVLGNDVHDHSRNHPVEDRQKRLPADGRGGDLQEPLGKRHILAAHAILGHAAQNLHGAQGGNKGRHFSIRDQQTVALTQQSREGNRQKNRQKDCRNARKADRIEPAHSAGIQ